ncbi:hypothetical protein ACFFX0_15280 [Citricoccus parietis]|uniref:Uncharacterized protein n=1 Tax=Citricoccus parietis TaxID=592307 RepID=A0ABV5G0M6_9MICC
MAAGIRDDPLSEGRDWCGGTQASRVAPHVTRFTRGKPPRVPLNRISGEAGHKDRDTRSGLTPSGRTLEREPAFRRRTHPPPQSRGRFPTIPESPRVAESSTGTCTLRLTSAMV